MFVCWFERVYTVYMHSAFWQILWRSSIKRRFENPLFVGLPRASIRIIFFMFQPKWSTFFSKKDACFCCHCFGWVRNFQNHPRGAHVQTFTLKVGLIIGLSLGWTKIHPTQKGPLTYIHSPRNGEPERLPVVSTQIIPTSHDVTPKGGLVEKFPLFQGKI